MRLTTTLSCTATPAAPQAEQTHVKVAHRSSIGPAHKTCEGNGLTGLFPPRFFPWFRLYACGLGPAEQLFVIPLLNCFYFILCLWSKVAGCPLPPCQMPVATQHVSSTPKPYGLKGKKHHAPAILHPKGISSFSCRLLRLWRLQKADKGFPFSASSEPLRALGRPTAWPRRRGETALSPEASKVHREPGSPPPIGDVMVSRTPSEEEAMQSAAGGISVPQPRRRPSSSVRPHMRAKWQFIPNRPARRHFDLCFRQTPSLLSQPGSPSPDWEARMRGCPHTRAFRHLSSLQAQTLRHPLMDRLGPRRPTAAPSRIRPPLCSGWVTPRPLTMGERQTVLCRCRPSHVLPWISLGPSALRPSAERTQVFFHRFQRRRTRARCGCVRRGRRERL